MRVLLAAAVAAAASSCWAQAPDCKLVPGWQQKGPARSYVADNLFEYMNGNAEGYLIYGFLTMHGATCTQGDKEFVIDISEMADPDSAYGIFTANRDPRAPAETIGMGGQVQPRKGSFAKGNYYVEIAASPEGDHSAALRAYLTAIEKQLQGRTEPPEALSWFPQEKLASLRLVPESVLGIRLLKRGYAAQYDYGKAFLVKETSADAAGAVFQKLRARYPAAQTAEVGQEAFHLTDRYLGRLCFFRKGQYLGGWANVAEGQDPLALATALAAKAR